MKPFFLNNSSFSILSCAKRYHLQVVQGLRPPPGGNKYTTPGLAFHKMMQLVGTEGYPNMAMLAMFDKNKHKEIAVIPEVQAIQLAKLADRIYEEHPEMYVDCRRELHFEYQTAVDMPEVTTEIEHQATRCGTIDLISYDSQSDTVILTDYKTTGKPIDGQLITNYSLSSQRHFYTLAAYYLELPEHFKAAIKSHRVAWRYCYVGIDKDVYHLAQPSLVDLNELTVFARLFTEKALYAAAIHQDPTLALKDGILSNLCWRCPFTSICTAEIEDNLITNWPYGKKPYTYLHNDE